MFGFEIWTPSLDPIIQENSRIRSGWCNPILLPLGPKAPPHNLLSEFHINRTNIMKHFDARIENIGHLNGHEISRFGVETLEPGIILYVSGVQLEKVPRNQS
jgi:hypothetical protein